MVMDVIIPTRGRPESMQLQVNLMKDNVKGKGTRIAFCIDYDDPKFDEYLAIELPDNMTIFTASRMGMNGTLNHYAKMFAEEMKGDDVLAFMGDDHRPRSVGWDVTMRNVVQLETPTVAYGNDLLQGQNLATAVFMSAHVVKRLGYMAPPGLKHLYLDDFWMKLGSRTTLVYVPQVIIEHMHPTIGKGVWDEGYILNNSNEMYAHDSAEFNRYLAEDFEKDMVKVHGS